MRCLHGKFVMLSGIAILKQGNHHHCMQMPPPAHSASCNMCIIHLHVCTFIGTVNGLVVHAIQEKHHQYKLQNVTITMAASAVCELAEGRKAPAVRVTCSWSCRTNMSTGCSGMQQPHAGCIHRDTRSGGS